MRRMKRTPLASLALLSLTLVLGLTYSPARSAAQLPQRATTAMVVTAHPLASRIGINVIRMGGNAVDAAVAVGFALAVVLPWAGNIGGGGFMVYMGNNGDVTTFDFREKAPMRATARMFLDEGGGGIKANSNHEGGGSVGVPGTVAGLLAIHDKFGTLPLKTLMQPAIDLAEKGFPVTYALWDYLIRFEEKLKRDPAAAAVFFKEDGGAYVPGDIWKQPELAKTLTLIKRRGRAGFYKGRTAKLLVNAARKHGGIITLDDLLRYEPIERRPVQGSYRGYDIYSVPPPSSGGVTLIEMLNILEGYDLKRMGHNSALYMHLLTESMRHAYKDRAMFLGDPGFNHASPIGMLTSKEYARTIREGINPEAAGVSATSDVIQKYESGETTHFSIVDALGNAISLTYTLDYPFGSGIVVKGAGFLLNNEMGDFNPVPGVTTKAGQIGTAANLVAPGKRMLSSMTPTIVAKDGKPVIVLGSPGGRTIINTVLQVILNVIDNGMNIEQAVEAGRIHHQWLPDVTVIEKWATTSDSLRIYESLGHRVRIREGGAQGSVMAVHINRSAGVIEGSADRRRPEASAIGWSKRSKGDRGRNE